MRIRYTPKALAELDEILLKIESQSPRGAARVQARIKTVIDLLIQYPRSGKLTSFREIRRVLVTPFPYLIFYQIAAEDIIVIGVRHGARDPSSMPDAT